MTRIHLQLPGHRLPDGTIALRVGLPTLYGPGSRRIDHELAGG